MMASFASTDLEQLQSLIERWCDRREYRALSEVLPAWINNNGLTDGWAELHDALKRCYASSTSLPSEERESLKALYVAIDVMLRNR